MGNSLLFVSVSFQPAGKNLLPIFSTVSPDFHNATNDERESKSPDTFRAHADSITLNTEPLSHVSAVIVPQL